MASIRELEKRALKAQEQHKRTATKLEELKRKFEEEEKALQRELDKVNAEWGRTLSQELKNFVPGLQVSHIDTQKLASLIQKHVNELTISDNDTSPDTDREAKAS